MVQKPSVRPVNFGRRKKTGEVFSPGNPNSSNTTYNRVPKWTDEQRAIFVATIAITGQPQKAADAAGVSITAAKDLYASDAEFANDVDSAKRRFNERLETEIYRRGVEGWEEPVFGLCDGDTQQVGTVRKYSDRMLELIAKRHMPAYRSDAKALANPNQHHPSDALGLGGPVGAAGQLSLDLASLSPESRAQLRAILEREQTLHASRALMGEEGN